ncbi:DUF6316 family protein [Glaciecola petra]|uniref:DUF6316 family protein n=1 Tax=Glaciecola petra TaxID=3075602 RepID=A0ABU2ZMY1_9ALTE|nr:DUF6316 family protein [Aestuariibacter sp. P117]MDT0593765.1 DUF6316 family protein [Aestuariibacter sp. P117]
MAIENDIDNSQAAQTNESSTPSTNWFKSKMRNIQRWWARRKVKVTEDIVPYRRLALQFVHDKTQSPTMLVVSTDKDDSVAHSCVLLTMALTSIVKKPVLLIDISNTGSAIPDLLGCQSRAGESGTFTPDARKKRFYENDEGWFFNTREGETIGPFLSLEDAKLELENYIENDLFTTDGTTTSKTNQFILTSQAKNIDYMSAVSAGLHGSLENKSEDEAMRQIADLINEVQDNYEYVIFYAGYLLDSSTALKVAPHAGRVVLASIENKTGQKEYLDAAKTLRLCDVNYYVNMLVKISGKARASSTINT